jgi:hypothetical protein
MNAILLRLIFPCKDPWFFLTDFPFDLSFLLIVILGSGLLGGKNRFGWNI